MINSKNFLKNDSKKKLLIFFSIFATIFISLFFIDFGVNPFSSKDIAQRFPFDSGDYWNRAKKILNGTDDGFRGYFFPLYLGAIGSLWNNVVLWTIFNIAFNSLFFSLFFPMFLLSKENRIYDLQRSIRIFISFLLFYICYFGLIVYPLSDVFTIQCAVISIICIRRMISHIKSGNSKYLFFAFISGFVMYITYNVRTIYLFFVLTEFILMIILFFKEKIKISKQFLCLLIIVFGLIFASIPQVIFNFNNTKKLSPFVHTSNLIFQQLKWGLEMKRCDGYVGENKEIPPLMVYSDNSGIKLLNELNNDTIKSYIKLCIKHPIEISGVVVRHFINMIFPAFPSVYIRNQSSHKIFPVFVSFTVYFLFAFSLITGILRLNNNAASFLPIFISLLFILPGAVEQRFGASVFIFTSFNLILNVNVKKLLEEISLHKIRFIISYFGILLLLIAIWTDCLGSYAQDILIAW